MYMITPRMVRMEGVNTPANAPYFFACAMDSRLLREI
jgi:hypothetical protein